MKVDMHVHSKYSNDSASKPKDIVKWAIKKEMNFCITDHDVFRAYNELKSLVKDKGIFVVPGEEVKVYKDDKFIGELLIYFIQKEIKKGDVFEVLDKAREQDAVISIAHPFDASRKPYVSGFKEIMDVAKKVDAIECFNAHCLTSSPNNKARRLAEDLGLGKTAGSDAHIADEIGNGYVKVYGSEIEDLRKAILKRQTIPAGKLNSPIRKITGPVINAVGKLVSEK